MPIDLSPTSQQRLLDEQIIWLTTVNAAGQPQPTPVWFLWTADHALIYSEPGALKIRNLAQNPRVALNLNGTDDGGNVVILTGEAVIDPAGATPAELEVYLAKYANGIVRIGHNPESFIAQYSMVIRIRPTRVRLIE